MKIKKCRSCKTSIPASSRVCPYCYERQRSLLALVLASLFLISLAVLYYSYTMRSGDDGGVGTGSVVRGEGVATAPQGPAPSPPGVRKSSGITESMEQGGSGETERKAVHVSERPPVAPKTSHRTIINRPGTGENKEKRVSLTRKVSDGSTGEKAPVVEKTQPSVENSTVPSSSEGDQAGEGPVGAGTSAVTGIPPAAAPNPDAGDAVAPPADTASGTDTAGESRTPGAGQAAGAPAVIEKEPGPGPASSAVQ